MTTQKCTNQNVVNREVILEQVADKGLFVICIRSVHLFTESFVSVFYLVIRRLVLSRNKLTTRNAEKDLHLCKYELTIS